jgi:hypothetical protein
MNNYVKYGLIGILLLALGFGVGKYSNPAKIQTVTEIKEVVKVVEVKQENKNVVLKTKKTTHIDGTIVEESVMEDKSITKTDTQIDSKKESNTETITTRDIGLNLGLLAIRDINKLSDKTEYALVIKKRVFSAVTINGMISSDKKIGVGLGWDF